MTRIFRAELLKLRRRSVLVTAAACALAFAVITSLAVFLPADGGGGGRFGTAALSRSGGVTEAFSTGASFIGILVLVLFIATFAGELSRGTARTLLMHQPRRLALLSGKLVALLAFAAAVLLLAAALTAAASLAIAPGQGVSTSAWLSLDGLGQAAAGYGTAVLGVTAWATLGMAIAVLVGSTPIALGIGIAWSGPIEHLVSDLWGGAREWFPGLLLEALAVRGTAAVPYGHAATLLGVYVAAGLAIAAVAFRRRDVTS